MHRLLYLSAAKNLFSKEQLVELLEKSRRNNHRLGVTGLLLYHGGDFLQLLEGEAAVVQPLYRRIASDSRHHNVTVLIDEPCESRLFAEWSMGFRDLSDPPVQQLPGFAPYLNKPLTHQSLLEHPDDAMQLIALFASPDRR